MGGRSSLWRIGDSLRQSVQSRLLKMLISWCGPSLPTQVALCLSCFTRICVHVPHCIHAHSAYAHTCTGVHDLLCTPVMAKCRANIFFIRSSSRKKEQEGHVTQQLCYGNGMHHKDAIVVTRHICSVFRTSAMLAAAKWRHQQKSALDCHR